MSGKFPNSFQSRGSSNFTSPALVFEKIAVLLFSLIRLIILSRAVSCGRMKFLNSESLENDSVVFKVLSSLLIVITFFRHEFSHEGIACGLYLFLRRLMCIIRGYINT